MQRLLRSSFFGAAAIAFVMAVIPHPPELPGAPWDKLLHAIAFVTLGGLGALAFPKLSALRLVLALTAFGAWIELAQAIPMLHRDSEFADLVVDGLAAVVAVAVARFITALFRGGRQSP